MLNKILSSAQIKKADAFTIKNEPISSIDLMERASKAFVDAILPHLKPKQTIAVVCGTGNNGGDGLAVARILMWKGYDVQPYLFMIGDRLSDDCALNNDKIDNVITVPKDSDIPDLQEYDCVIDGLFGSGLNREVDGWAGDIVDAINRSNGIVFSIDIPSGMFCDIVPVGTHIVESDVAVSFQRPKLSFFFKESDPYIKDWKVVDIGLDEDFIQSQESHYFVLDHLISNTIKNRERYSHKGSYGHALIIAGARGKMGAAILSGKGCLRSGAGLLTIHIPNCGLDIMQTALPEAMCNIDPHSFHFSTLPALEKMSCVGVGPGIGTAIETKEALVHLLNTCELPLVLDADALNIISQDETIHALISNDSILTPHPKEFERLVGGWDNSLERLEKQISFSKRHNCIIVLKDAVTVITDQAGNSYYNTTGNPGMATGGSGDVLTGIITGLLAQKYSALDAALLGVYYHGKAGDKASVKKGVNALLASDIIEALRIE